MKTFLNRSFLRPLIPKHDLKPFGKKRHLTETMLQHVIIEHSILKYGIIWQKYHLRSSPVSITIPNDMQLFHYFSPLITLLIDMSFLRNLHLKPVRQSIDNRSAYPVKTSGYLISPASELAAGMKYGKYDLHRRESCLVIDPHRNPPAVIHNRYRIILIDRYKYGIAKTSQGFIYRVIHNLVHKMMKSA